MSSDTIRSVYAAEYNDDESTTVQTQGRVYSNFDLNSSLENPIVISHYFLWKNEKNMSFKTGTKNAIKRTLWIEKIILWLWCCFNRIKILKRDKNSARSFMCSSAFFKFTTKYIKLMVCYTCFNYLSESNFFQST